VKSADQIQAELALAAGAAEAAQPDEPNAQVTLVKMTRPDAVERLRVLEAKVDRIADRVLELREEGREKRANRAYARAVRLQAEANDLREALENGFILREVT
jgi:PAS domain-containing protein